MKALRNIYIIEISKYFQLNAVFALCKRIVSDSFMHVVVKWWEAT